MVLSPLLGFDLVNFVGKSNSAGGRSVHFHDRTSELVILIVEFPHTVDDR